MQNRRVELIFGKKNIEADRLKQEWYKVGLSPALINYSLADFPSPPFRIKLIKYADDITIETSRAVVEDIINGFN